MRSIKIPTQACPSFPSYTFILFGAELKNLTLKKKEKRIKDDIPLNKCAPAEYLSLVRSLRPLSGETGGPDDPAL